MLEGKISLTKLNEEEYGYFLDYLYSNKDFECIDFLASVLGDDLFTFLDLFEGETIKIPPRKTTLNIISNITIYTYVKDRDFKPSAYESASRIFKKRITAIERIVEKTHNILNGSMSFVACHNENENKEEK